jgi:hypothetical protein
MATQYGTSATSYYFADVVNGINRSFNTQELDTVISGVLRTAGSTYTADDVSAWRLANMKDAYKQACLEAGIDYYHDNLTTISGNDDLTLYQGYHEGPYYYLLNPPGTTFVYNTANYDENDPYQYIGIDFAAGKVLENISFTTSSGWYYEDSEEYFIAYFIGYTTYDDPSTWKLLSDSGSTNLEEFYDGITSQIPTIYSLYDIDSAWESPFFHFTQDFTRTITHTFEKPVNVKQIRIYLGDVYPIAFTLASGTPSDITYDGTFDEITYAQYNTKTFTKEVIINADWGYEPGSWKLKIDPNGHLAFMWHDGAGYSTMLTISGVPLE